MPSDDRELQRRNRSTRIELPNRPARRTESVTSRIRVLVAEDSTSARRRLCEIVAADPELKLVAEAENGKRAIELCSRYRPDVISMDMGMPVMSGFSATEYIMAHCPTPILVVASAEHRVDSFKTYDALAAGAVDVLEKPPAQVPPESWQKKYAAALKRVSRLRVMTRPAPFAPSALCERGAAPPPVARRVELVAIGASTGGLAAIIEIVRALPPHFRLPILIVHVNHTYSFSFAEWLASQTNRRVSAAVGGESLQSLVGHIVLAPPDRHLIVRRGHLALTGDAPRHSCRPSVDTLFDSIAHQCGATSAACLLTGMGTDGAAGLLAIREAGGLTIAQDAATSVIYGMPRAAVLIGAAERELPLHLIGAALAELAEKSGGVPV